MASTPPPLNIHGNETIEENEQTNSTDEEHNTASEFKCQQCGAKLTYKPGTGSLVCGYCDHRNEIPESEDDIHIGNDERSN